MAKEGMSTFTITPNLTSSYRSSTSSSTAALLLSTTLCSQLLPILLTTWISLLSIISIKPQIPIPPSSQLFHPYFYLHPKSNLFYDLCHQSKLVPYPFPKILPQPPTPPHRPALPPLVPVPKPPSPPQTTSFSPSCSCASPPSNPHNSLGDPHGKESWLSGGDKPSVFKVGEVVGVLLLLMFQQQLYHICP